MKKLYYILFIGLIFASCHDSNDDTVVNDTVILLKYVDGNGINILDQANGITSSNIKIYYEINGEWAEYYNPNLTFPKGYFVIERNNEKYLSLFPSDNYYNNNFSRTKIQFSENEFDIIRIKINPSNGNIICTKVWYNENLEWDSIETERLIEIIK